MKSLIQDEIERKFIIKQIPDNLKVLATKVIEQNYLAIGDEEVRIRKVTQGDNHSYFHTIKIGTGKTRQEAELPIQEATYQQLNDSQNSVALMKVRMNVLYQNQPLEIDIYTQDPIKELEIAEIEFPSEEASNEFIPFEWLGKEVTEDKSYKNQSLWKLIQNQN